MAIKLTSNTIKYLISKGYVDDSYATSVIHLHKDYNKTLYVSTDHSPYRPDQINLSCLFDIKGLIDSFSLTTFPLSEIQKQLTEIFGPCFAQIYISEEFQIVFYLYKEEELIKWIDLLEEDREEFISLIFDLINDIGEK